MGRQTRLVVVGRVVAVVVGPARVVVVGPTDGWGAGGGPGVVMPATAPPGGVVPSGGGPVVPGGAAPPGLVGVVVGAVVVVVVGAVVVTVELGASGVVALWGLASVVVAMVTTRMTAARAMPTAELAHSLGPTPGNSRARRSISA
jgi:hypothetical protein